jgi:hypothetical protein
VLSEFAVFPQKKTMKERNKPPRPISFSSKSLLISKQSKRPRTTNLWKPIENLPSAFATSAIALINDLGLGLSPDTSTLKMLEYNPFHGRIPAQLR